MEFFIDDPSCQIHPFEDLFRALGKRPLLRRKPKLASTLCSLSQSYNELHMFEVKHISSKMNKLKYKIQLYKCTR